MFLSGQKYVILASGQVRTGDGMIYSHKGLAKGEEVVSAGFFAYDPEDDWLKVSGFSMTLGLYPKEGDDVLILQAMKENLQ